MPRAVILTTHPADCWAVRSYLISLKEETHSQGTVYELGRFSANGQTWEVAIAEVNAGNSDAAAETERAIAHWQPNVILSVGVATGLKKDVTTGDVVAAIEVYGYEFGKETESGFLTRPKMGLASYRLEQRAKATARREDWLERIQQEDRSSWMPKAVVGAIAAGDKEITSSQSAIYQLLQSNYGDALAVDVTGYGVLKAVHANAETNALIIRGITHVIDHDGTIDPDQARIVAAQHASAFAFEILAKLEGTSSIGLSSAEYTKLKQHLADASKGLLSWQRTLSNGRQIKRPELDELLNCIETADSSTTIVLGVPGSGKSALMATLGNELITQGYSVLAIKADQLNGAINTIEDLQRDLHFTLHPSDAIYAIASKERIIVLIDQLDAVSELLDRKSQRLTLLLSLIQRLSGSKNVHVVATCREFEFRYGSQFARLAEIDHLFLKLPTWEEIASILELAGHQPAGMGEPLRELLQNPLHLNIFLAIAQPGDAFTSSQNLLDRLWEERVKKQPNTEECITFLEKLADRMTEEEVLWLPGAFADQSPKAWQTLEQAGLLITNPENGTIGFRHQTYYDHTLARAFACGAQSLTDLVLERQDGLFIRPVLLRSLNYLRGTATRQYQKQLTNLLQTFQQQIRPHIRNLLIEFVGAQPNPDPVEAGLLIPLLNSETEAIKVLNAVVGSPGWFRKLRDRPEFRQWLEKPAEQAVYCCPILQAAVSFAAEDVWELLEEYWLDEQTYDFLSIQVIWNTTQWTPDRVCLTQQIIQRSNIGWHDVAVIAERIAEFLPSQAARIIRSHLDYQLTQAIEASKVPPPVLPSDMGNLPVDYFHESGMLPLRSARVQREQYVGSWLPEPITMPQSDDPAEQIELADSLSMAFLVMLERLSPIERAVFLLREVFEYDYDEIAQMVGKSSTNCRKILRRSRQHIASQRPRFSVSQQQQEHITEQFLEASTQGNLQGLLTLLAEDVTYWSDGGGQVAAALKPLHGAMKVARFVLAIHRKWLSTAVFHIVKVNGHPGIVTVVDFNVHSVTTFDIVDGHIQSVYTVRNPRKLKQICNQ
ncbi:phosphorylase family protein [Egbenema bharatensis]|uniref:phosphorylase family protein n=1 Tax=Egbenema bharatensis TaxID=3463334 RepID=UPI003A8B89CE